MKIEDYDIIRTRDDLWLYACTSVKREGGVFGYLKYASCRENEKTTTIDGIPAFRVWTKNPRFYTDQVAQRATRYKADTVCEAKFYIRYEDIVQVYAAKDATQRLLGKKGSLQQPERNCIELLNHIRSIGIGMEEVGLIGSFLLDSVGINSDIDLLMLSSDAYKKLWNSLAQNAPGNITFRSAEDWANYELYGTGVGLAKQEFARHNARKFDRGFINQTEFSIVGRNNNPINIADNSRLLKEGATMFGRVIDSQHAYSLPGVYTVATSQADVELPESLILINYDREFVNQMHAGEDFYAKGNIVESGGREYFVIGPSQRPMAALMALGPLEKKLL